MNESSSAKNGGGDGIPAWMKTVNEETFYNARPADDEEEEPPSAPSSSSAAPAASDRPSVETAADGSSESLHQKLSISMGTPLEIPEPDPDSQPEIVGHVRADLNQRLEKAVAVLETRYTKGLSKSLLIEFALRQMLLDLQEQDEGSALVRWLDSILPRS